VELREIPLEGTFCNHKGLLLRVGEVISNCLSEVDVLELKIRYYSKHLVIVSFITKMIWRTILMVGDVKLQFHIGTGFYYLNTFNLESTTKLLTLSSHIWCLSRSFVGALIEPR
jgi:hypothetical protein